MINPNIKPQKIIFVPIKISCLVSIASFIESSDMHLRIIRQIGFCRNITAIKFQTFVNLNNNPIFVSRVGVVVVAVGVAVVAACWLVLVNAGRFIIALIIRL